MTSKQRKPTKAPARPGPTGQTAAQKRLAAQRAMAAASGARAARRRRLYTVLGPVVAVVVIVVIFVVVRATVHSSSVDHTPMPASAALQAQVTGVPASVLDQVGTGSGVTPPKAVNGPPLTADGKPRVLYVGAEWCPFCAAERWPLAVALSRFGALTGLQTTYSSASDVNKNTPTLTFHGAKYTSSTISLTASEIQDGNRKPLDTLSAADSSLFNGAGGGSFPFIDIGGKYVISGASYNPAILAGKTHAQIAAALSDPSSKIAKAVGGTANYISAAICASTGDKPASVCSSSGVTAAAAALNAG